MTWKVFLSFDAQDADLAKGLAKKLTEVGVEVVSPPPIELRPGEDLLATVESRMRDCDEIVVLLTENSLDAPRVVMEMGAAYGMHKPVVPISLGVDDDSFVKDLPSRYTDIERYVEDLRKRSSVSEDKLERDMLVILQIIKKLRDEGKPRVSLAQVSKTLAMVSASLPKAARLAWRPYTFGPYTYGLHSRDFQHVLQELAKSGYVKVQRKHIVQLTDQGRTHASRTASELAPDVEKTITRVLEKPLEVQRKHARSKHAGG